MRTVLLIAVTAAALCLQCNCQANKPRSVGEGCDADNECVSAAHCDNTAKQCTCPDGASHLADFTACVLVGAQKITQTACTKMENCTQNLEGASRCLVLTSTDSRCICDPGYDINVPHNTTCTLPCTNHHFCAKVNPVNVCLNNSEDFAPHTSICRMKACLSDVNCTDIPDTKCALVGSDTKLRSCQLTLSSNDTDNSTRGEADSEMEEMLDTYLLVGLGIIVGGLFLTLVTVMLLMIGFCSGDPGSKPVRGRGLSFVKRRIPPKFVGMPMAVPQRPKRSPSVISRGRSPSEMGSYVIMRRPSQSVSYAPSATSLGSSAAESSTVFEPSGVSVEPSSVSHGSTWTDGPSTVMVVQR